MEEDPNFQKKYELLHCALKPFSGAQLFPKLTSYCTVALLPPPPPLLNPIPHDIVCKCVCALLCRQFQPIRLLFRVNPIAPVY